MTADSGMLPRATRFRSGSSRQRRRLLVSLALISALGLASVALFPGHRHNCSTYSGDDRISLSSSDICGVAVYAGSQWDKLGLRLGVIYTWSDVEAARAASFALFSNALSGDYDAGTAQLFADLGDRIELGPEAYEPLVGCAHPSRAFLWCVA